mgnify:CR=1 FL=1
MELWQFIALLGALIWAVATIRAPIKQLQVDLRGLREDALREAMLIKDMLREYLDEEHFPEWLGNQILEAQKINDEEHLKKLKEIQRNRFPIAQLRDDINKFSWETLMRLERIDNAVNKQE